jgi:hypothetical protein
MRSKLPGHSKEGEKGGALHSESEAPTVRGRGKGSDRIAGALARDSIAELRSNEGSDLAPPALLMKSVLYD